MNNYLASPWVVVPTYNEKDNIKQLISSLFNLHLDNLSVLIVDDSSPDGTSRIVKSLQSRYPSLHLKLRPLKQGLGRAYTDGFKYAIDQGATAIAHMDADFSHNPQDVPRLLDTLHNHDLVIGSRYVNGISVVNWPLKRLIISMAANLYARLITGLPYKDVTGGFKVWRASALRTIHFASVNADGYGWQFATTYRAWTSRLRITEIPIVFTERREGQSKMSRQIILEAMLLAWKLRFSK